MLVSSSCHKILDCGLDAVCDYSRVGHYQKVRAGLGWWQGGPSYTKMCEGAGINSLGEVFVGPGRPVVLRARRRRLLAKFRAATCLFP